MKNKKNNKDNRLSTNEKLVRIFEDRIPEDRMKIFNSIDTIMMSMFELDRNDLPWINPNKHEEKWENLMNKLRLMIGRIEYESRQKERTIH